VIDATFFEIIHILCTWLKKNPVEACKSNLLAAEIKMAVVLTLFLPAMGGISPYMSIM
jgi:hypothetical protein